MKRIIFLIVLIVSDFYVIYSQNDTKFILKISGGAITDTRKFNYPYIDEQHIGGSWVNKKNIPHVRLETCYSLNNEIDFGFYAGISNLTVPVNPNDIYDNTSITTNGYFLGTELNYHILPLFIKQPIRFDIYSTAKIGMLLKGWKGYDNLSINTDNVFEIGIGLGSSYYFTQNFGIFSEVLIGKFYYSNLNWRSGLSFKF